MTTFTTPAEYGIWLAEQAPPISDEQAEAAARVLAVGDDPVAQVAS